MPSGKHGLMLRRHSFLLGHTIVNLRREMSKQRERYVLNLDQNIQKGINRVKSQFFMAVVDIGNPTHMLIITKYPAGVLRLSVWVARCLIEILKI